MANKQYLIDRIEEKYDPDFDIPAKPQVTWVDAYLLDLVKDLYEKVERLERQLKEQLEPDAGSMGEYQHRYGQGGS